MIPSGADPSGPAIDPLVPPADGGLRQWSQWLSDTWQRSWRLVATIFVVTAGVPHVVAAVILDHASGAAPTRGFPLLAPDGLAGVSPLAAAAWLLASLAVALLAAIGWGGAIWAVTQDAVGLPASLAAALRAGTRRAGPMLGWYLLYLFLIAAGMLLLVLPGLYIAFAGALFGFVVVYERGRAALVRSVVLVHQALAMALGRVLLLFFLAMIVTVVASGVSMGLGLLPSGGSPGNPVALAVVEALALVTTNTVLLIGLLLIYTQLRARSEPVTSGRLWQEANRGPVDPFPRS